MQRMLAAILGLVMLAAGAEAGTVRDLVRFKGQGESVLRGFGLVVGLPQTGDSGKDLALARPLAKLLESNGAGIGDVKDLEKSKTVALVMVTCTVPASGARADDTLDVWVSAVGNASSLDGGQLFLAPLRGPYVGSPVYAMSEGTVEIEGGVRTRGRVRGGARMIQDVLMPEIGDSFDLIIDRPFADWSTAMQVALAINAKAMPTGPAVARAIDDRTVRVSIPEAERRDRAGFIADVLSADISLAQIDLPATIVYNAKRGAILVDGDVTIGAVAITHSNLQITTTTPPPQATPQNPIVEVERWAGLAPGAKPSEQARLSDLLAAFKQLDIPTTEQIAVLEMLHKMGKLQAKIVID
ncbi:MAG: flagellar basal body P-ring protein FlgI [Planctomycetota bacterium]|nr:flagellar basal body P-ring protein FlgI [Planctomycetota bacterium]